MIAPRRIAALPARPLRPPEPGARPRLEWVRVASLVVDETYQRAISERGLRNIRQIAENFRWSRFAPIVVAKRDDGDFAFVDGQHRATAAATIGVEEVPAVIVEASKRECAEAFTYINTATTALTSMARFHAAVAACDPLSLAAQRCLDAAGAQVVRYPVALAQMRPGQTMAGGALVACVAQFGEAPLTLALRIAVAQGKGGLLSAPLVKGLTRYLAGAPALLAAPEAALQRCVTIDFSDIVAKAYARRTSAGSRTDMIVAEILAEQLGEAAVKSIAPSGGRLASRPLPPPQSVTARASVGQRSTVADAGALISRRDAARPMSAPMQVDCRLIGALLSGAGAAFGASADNVALGIGVEGARGRDACIAWLVDKGVAPGVIVERFSGVDVETARHRSVAARAILTSMFSRFDMSMAAVLAAHGRGRK